MVNRAIVNLDASQLFVIGPPWVVTPAMPSLLTPSRPCRTCVKKTCLTVAHRQPHTLITVF